MSNAFIYQLHSFKILPLLEICYSEEAIFLKNLIFCVEEMNTDKNQTY